MSLLMLFVAVILGEVAANYQKFWITGDKGDTVTCSGENFTDVPTDLPNNITKLYLSNMRIKTIPPDAFHKYNYIRELHIRNFTELTTLQPNAFGGLKELRILWIIDCLKLSTVSKAALGLFNELNTLKITKSGLVKVPDFSMFETKSKEHNGTMYEIDLSSNKIKVIESRTFQSVKTWLLRLENNDLEEIKDEAFAGSHIAKIDFENNPSLRTLGEFAFDGIQELKSLNLSKTRISYLPTVGLTSIEDLNLEHTHTLRIFPSVLQFSNIKVARLTYAHHCCAFQHPEKQDPQLWKAYEFQETVRKKCETPQTVSTSSIWVLTQSPVTEHFRIRIRRSGDQHDKWGDFGGSLHDSMGSNGFGTFPEPSTPFPRTKTTKKSTIFDEIYHDNTTLSENNTEPQIVACGNISRIYSEVICTPQPNAFNPCEDVMGYEWLRVVVWFVVLAALLGNLVVILVLITGRSKMTVPKFLMCNLSVADFLMGFYLLLIASIDIHSLGEYFNHAVSWQNDGGCQVAGFLTVFASELSIYILTVLTIERWYAISYAIHLTKRLKLRQASALMVIGWCYAILMASLPLLGISGYGTVSICLPMEATDLLDRGYICSLLILNGVAFLVICCCYLNMYFKVRKSDTTANSNDATIAKRMSLLVFTNFVCWAPIAFFGLTASAGFPLIDITNSKILLVFFYPLNSCANPFLYVILTKQFRKDVFILLGRYGICTERANRYKGTYSGSKTISNSRHNGMHLHNVQQAPDLSVLAHISKGIHKGSKMSLNGSSTPHSTPITTPSLTPKQSPSARVQDIEQTPNVPSGAWSGIDKNKERKLSTVPETSQGSDDFDCEATCIIEATEGLKDILDDRGSNRVRSASEYVILYPACQRENRKRLCRTSYDKQASMETSLSSATETSYLSDSSWRESAEIEKLPSVEQSTSEGDDGQAVCEVVKPSPSTVQKRRQNFRNSPVEQSVICQSSDEEELDATQSLL